MAALMQIDGLLRRWLDVLAANYFAWRDAWRGQRTLVITRESDRFVIRKAAPDNKNGSRPQDEAERSALAVLRAGEPASDEILRAAQWGSVVLEIPNENVVVRRISVPVRAREFVAGIIRNQIDRLSPWPSDQAAYGFEADVDPQEPATLDVQVLIAARSAIDAAREQITAIGLTVDRVVASRCRAGNAKAVTLWSRLADVSPEYQALMRRQIGIGIAATIAACLVLCIWAMISASFIRGRSDDIATRIDTLRRQLQGPATLQSAASLPPNEREWYDKETSPSAIIVIEDLSRALPDSAYLTEFTLQNITLRIVGLTTDAPPLIASLEHSGSLTGVHFFAPTTREADGRHFRFHIEGRLARHCRGGKTMTNSDREALLSVGALGALLFVCANAVGFSWQARSNAAGEFALRSAQLSQLEAHVANRNKARLSSAAAPPAAFLAAPTQGLAGAQLQAYLQNVADTHHATLISSGMEATKHEDQPDSIRLQATLDANLQALQALLYQLESGTPYVFVDSLNIQIPGTNAQHAVEDPLLRVTLGLRAVWRHETT